MFRLSQVAVFAGIVGLFLPAPASADTVAVGDFVRFLGSEGTLGGGPFLLDDTANGPGFDFLTFCVQETQYIDYSNQFRVGSITDYADDAAGPDYLSPETTWIYSNFRRGNLGAYTGNEIQTAIWNLEGEGTFSYGNSGALIAAAETAVAAGWTNDGVKVLNLFYTSGTPAQDQLTYAPVPEPGSLLLLGSGLMACAHAARRRFQARRSA